MTPNIVFVFKHPKAEDPSACHMGMGVTATNCAMALKEARIQADARPVVNGEYLWGMLSGAWSDVTHVVLCAPFFDAPFLGRLAQAFPMKRFALVYHSNLGFLSVDRFAARSLPLFLELQQTCPNFTAAANSEELADAVCKASAAPAELAHLPNLYHLPHMTRRTRERWQPWTPLHVGLFGAARVLKNWLTATVAVMILQRAIGCAVSLHLSTGRDEHASSMRESLIDLLVLNTNVQVVNAPWMAVDDFRRYLYGMDLLLQPSFTETFNNVTADGCFCGVPSVVSDAIDWVPAEWIAKADSATDIARVAQNLLKDKHAAMKGWKALDAYNRSALQAWKNWIRK